MSGERGPKSSVLRSDACARAARRRAPGPDHPRRSAPPSRAAITNADLVARLDTSDEWIFRRTGIRERRHLLEGELLADLAASACRRR